MATGRGLREVFGERVRAQRVARGLSQEEFARLVGLDRTYLSGVERGARNVTLRVLEQIARALEVQGADLLAEDELPEQLAELDHAYCFDEGLEIDAGFAVVVEDVVAAVHQSNAVMRALPLSLYRTIDLKTQSGMVGAIFATEVASRVGAIPNPIEKGHPDIVPSSALGATEAELRNYPVGLEIKSTLGNVSKGSDLRAGEARVGSLSGLTWQAHHRDVRSLMALVWDFVDGTKSDLQRPVITAILYTNELEEDDWGAISGTTGRNTKVTGMKVSGKRKLGSGAIALLDNDIYRSVCPVPRR